jgi:hypothetical protein
LRIGKKTRNEQIDIGCGISGGGHHFCADFLQRINYLGTPSARGYFNACSAHALNHRHPHLPWANEPNLHFIPRSTR